MRDGRASFTAEVVALFRARHALLPPADRMLHDPYAQWFLGPLTRPLLRAIETLPGSRARWFDALSLGLYQFAVLRHHHFDQALLAAVDSGVTQVVLLGAGYDMRAYRFSERLSGVRYFEVDHPATAARKQAVVQRNAGILAACELHHISIDFSRQRLADVLPASGFDQSLRTLFIWEGVTMYLDRDAVSSTFHTLAGLSPDGSQLVFDYLGRSGDGSLAQWFHRHSPRLLRAIGEPIAWRIDADDLALLLQEACWRLAEVSSMPELGQRYAPGEPVPVLFDCFVATADLRE